MRSRALPGLPGDLARAGLQLGVRAWAFGCVLGRCVGWLCETSIAVRAVRINRNCRSCRGKGGGFGTGEGGAVDAGRGRWVMSVQTVSLPSSVPSWPYVGSA